MGANSGPTTQREHKFYAQREDITTYLRVHEIPGIMDIYDYSPAATGMTYHNQLNPTGVPVDGIPDTITFGIVDWEMVTGSQGTLVHTHWFFTDIVGFDPTLYYSDDLTPSVTQCQGSDDYEYAVSGPWVNHTIPNTDPMAGGGPAWIMHSFRTIYFEAPDQSTDLAVLRHLQATTDLVVEVAPFGCFTWQLQFGRLHPPDWGANCAGSCD
jgi:hypothetical protein